MSLSTIRDSIKTRYRETISDLDSMLDSFINQAYRKYARLYRWPTLLVENYQITTVAGTELYALPSDFFKMAQHGVRYDVTSTQPGTRLAEVGQQDMQAWKLMTEAGAPSVWSISPAASGSTKRIEFLPSFTETGKTIEIDYYKTPAELTEDTDSPVISEIEDILVYESLVHLATYHKDAEMATFFKQELREQIRANSQQFTFA